jgi:hypothetical protein
MHAALRQAFIATAFYDPVMTALSFGIDDVPEGAGETFVTYPND